MTTALPPTTPSATSQDRRRRWLLAVLAPLLALVATATVSVPAQATPDHFVPAKGVVFNNPYGGQKATYRIMTKLVRTINSVRPGHKIRIASWNFRSATIANALIRAHRRGVSVRLIMDYGNWNPKVPNVIAARTFRALRRGDKHRPADMTSWLRRCRGSCRGAHGIAHTKFYTFDQVQNAKDIVMYGSANATLLAATIQWNDLYTFRGVPSMYNEFQTVFDQMALDKTQKQGYLTYSHGAETLGFYPYTGVGTHNKNGALVDPVLHSLREIRCTGATAGTGIAGHTKIRIAQTATYGQRGLVLAERLARLQQQGCNIHLVYAMFGSQVLHILHKAKVPMTHLAYDADCNGIYDKYLHLKAMTVSGVYGASTHARITFNGSANWTPVSLESDEVVGTIVGGAVTRAYSGWIQYLFTHVPAAWKPDHCKGFTTVGGGGADRAMGDHGLGLPSGAPTHVDPYAIIRRDL